MRVSPSWRRRGAAFWAQRRGRVSLALFGLVFGLSLFANLLANDRPVLMVYKGRLYSPVFQRIPEATFGPDFLATPADFSDPAVRAAIRAQGWMIWPPIPYRYDTIVWDAPPAPAPPSRRHWLGTDDLSGDVLAEAIYGVRISVLFGLGLTALSCGFGILAGAIQGFYGGLTDLLAQRVSEIWSALPVLFLLMILASLLTPGFWLLLLLLAAFSWIGLANVARAEFLRARKLGYARAARALGVPDWRIMPRHLLPNAMIAVVTYLPFSLAESMVALASLDYLGFGLPPGTPSLGRLLSAARDNPQAPWLGIAACATLGGILLLLVFIGEALRDAFDPRRAR